MQMVNEILKLRHLQITVDVHSHKKKRLQFKVPGGEGKEAPVAIM